MKLQQKKQKVPVTTLVKNDKKKASAHKKSARIRFAIVGCGSIGKRHIAVVKANPEADLVAICDIDRSKTKEQSDLYGGIPIFISFEKMLDEVDCDVINIATPSHLHASMSILAMEKGFNVLAEKPMALTTSECNKINKVANKSKKKFWVVKQNRFNIPVLLTKEAIDNHWLGKIHLIKCDVLWNRHQKYYDDSPWRGKKALEGGALYTQASHFIDLLVWWFGDIIKAHTTVATRAHKIEVEDIGVSVVEFSNRAIGSIIWTTCIYEKNYEGSITVIGEKGTVKIGGEYLNKIEFWNIKEHPLPKNVKFTDKPNAYGKYQGTSSNHEKVIAAIISELKGHKHETVDGFEGIRSVSGIETIFRGISK